MLTSTRTKPAVPAAARTASTPSNLLQRACATCAAGGIADKEEAQGAIHRAPSTSHDFAKISALPNGVQPQAALRVSQPNDPSEREADRVADEVMRSTGTAPEVSLEDGEDDEVHPKERTGQPPAAAPGLAPSIHGLSGSGQPMDTATRSFFEPRFGHDFSQVRVHTGAAASDLASSVSARAFTVGHDVVFAKGEYAPGSDSGRRLLAHELTHVVQQQQATVNRMIFRSPSINSWSFKNSGRTSPDNCCSICHVDLGEDCRSADGYFNGMELQAFIDDDEAGASYDIERIAHAKYWERVGGSWNMLREWGPGHDDDSHNQDECRTSSVHQIPYLPSIYVEDRPGFRSRATPTSVDASATDAVLMANFTESVEITDSAGSTATDANSFDWHTVSWAKKTSGSWDFSTTNSEIATGHRASVAP